MNFVQKMMKRMWKKEKDPYEGGTSKDAEAKIDAKDDKESLTQVTKQIIVMRKYSKRKKRKKEESKNNDVGKWEALNKKKIELKHVIYWYPDVSFEVSINLL